MILLESNQNHATALETEICTTLPASMGMGGGYVPMIVDVLPFDTTQVTSPMNYSVPKWGDACHPLAANQHPPAVVIENEPLCYAFQAIGLYKRSDKASALKMRDFKDATDLVVEEEKFMGEATDQAKTYGLDRASYNQGKNAQYDFSVEEEKIGAQVAKGPGAVGVISEIEMKMDDATDIGERERGGDAMTSVVRRLTPLE